MFPLLAEKTDETLPLHGFRLTLAYDGTDYFGWQVQPGRRTIQGTLAEAIRNVTRESLLPQGSGRTDTGVHAEGQVVSLQLRAAIPPQRLQVALNRSLPAAIRVLTVAAVPASFHARANVLHKTYEYRIFQRVDNGARICPPGVARYQWDCPYRLDVEAMDHAAQVLQGRHDFTSFAASDPDRTARLQRSPTSLDNVRTILSSRWTCNGNALVYSVAGDGFLHHMVRNIVGTCVEVGIGRRNPSNMAALLNGRDRRMAGPTAPPQGLHLMQVTYASDPPAVTGGENV